MDEARVKRTVSAYFEALRALDVEAWVGTFAENGETHDPAGAPPHRGHDALRRFLTGIAAGFREVALHERKTFVAGQGAAVLWSGRGTGHNGRQVEFEGVDVFELDEHGKIRTLRAYWNPEPVLQELAAPPAGSPGSPDSSGSPRSDRR